MERDDDKTKMYEIKKMQSRKKTNRKSSSQNGDETKRVKTSKVKNKKNKNGKNRKHPKLRKFIKIFFILCILLFLVGAGVFAAIFFGDTWEMSKEDLVIKMQNSSTYDKDGKQLHELSGEENRKIIPLQEMGEYIPKAYVAIEDERFYNHNGIDLYRTAGAIFTYITHGGKSSFGGSTITQQLVKNLMDDDEDSISRKIREWSRAYKVENMLSKSQILELYLNEIFMGGTVYGVESGSKYYFNKSAKDLSLAESAFLAGINDSPNYYNPFGEDDKTDIIKDKTKLVLGKMLEVKDENGETFITQEEYDKAIAEVDAGLKFKEGEFTERSDLSFLEVEAINEAVEDLMEKYEIDQKAAEDRIYNNGYKIYTTQDSDIQDRMEEEYLKDKYIEDATTKKGKEENAHSQSGMVIIDHSNGQVVGCVGGLGEDSPTYGLNRAMYNNVGRQTGSSIKPLVAIAPALENNTITAATVFDDSRTDFGGGLKPGNSGGTYRGLITVRKAIEVSSNVVNIKILVDNGISEGLDFLNEIGMTQYNADDAYPTLALGGTAHGASPLQMAAAYAMIANGGEYIEPTFYTKVEDANGDPVLETTQEKKRVMTEGNAYILSSILESPVTGTNGTAYLCDISGMDVAAKTGTTDDLKDRWLCGFTPYYAAATWFGYDEPEVISISGMYNPAMNIWAAIMSDIHEGLKSASFEKPDNIVTAKICLDSGKKATKSCTRTYTEEFVEGTVPDDCDGHKTVEICSETGKLATEYCPEKKKKTYLSTPEKEIDVPWTTNAGSKYQTITETCDKHTKATMAINVQNVVGLTLAEAKAKLTGLTIKTVNATDNTKENGVILKQSVAAGEELIKGDTIILTINNVVEVEPEEPSTPLTNTITDPTTPNIPSTNNTITDPTTPNTPSTNNTTTPNTVSNTVVPNARISQNIN